jgi:hypothetical protein
MRKISRKPSHDNTLPLWRAAQEREFRALPYPAKRLVTRYGIAPDDAMRLAERIGWNLER